MKKYGQACLSMLVLLTAVIFFSWLLFGCRATKDRIALSRVKNTPDLLDKAGKEWEKSNGCVTSTTIQYLPGKEVHDTTIKYWQRANDTIIQIDSFETAFVKWKERIIRTNRVDTFVKVVEDTRRLQLARDSLKVEQGKVIQLTADRKTERKRGNNWMLAFFGICGIIGLGIFLQLKKII